jgi:hypothetical protein
MAAGSVRHRRGGRPARPGCRPARRPTRPRSARPSSGWGTAPAPPGVQRTRRNSRRLSGRGQSKSARTRQRRGGHSACPAARAAPAHGQQEGDEARHRVARQADEQRRRRRRRAARAEGQRLAGLHRDLPSSRGAFGQHAGRRWSSSPTETPPEVTIRSLPAAASRSASRVASSRSGTMPRSCTSQPAACSRPRSVKRLEL